jgi:hypothetical protein
VWCERVRQTKARGNETVRFGERTGKDEEDEEAGEEEATAAAEVSTGAVIVVQTRKRTEVIAENGFYILFEARRRASN